MQQCRHLKPVHFSVHPNDCTRPWSESATLWKASRSTKQNKLFLSMLDSPSPNDEAVALTNLPAKRLRDRSHLNFTSATVSTLRSPDRARALTFVHSFTRRRSVWSMKFIQRRAQAVVDRHWSATNQTILSLVACFTLLSRWMHACMRYTGTGISIPTLALGSRNKPANERHAKRDEVMLSMALRA